MTYSAMIRAKNPTFDLRLKMVRFAKTHGIRPAAKYFRCARNTVRLWLRRFEAYGNEGLKDHSRAPLNCPHQTPKQVESKVVAARKRIPYYGASRLKEEFDLKCSEGAISRILRQRGLTRKPKKKRQKKNDLRAVKAAYRAFEVLQVDVKYLTDIAHFWPQMRALGLPSFQFTCRDVKTGALFLGFAQERSVSHACVFVRRILAHLRRQGVDISQVTIQTDNGSEFDGTRHRLADRGFIHTIAAVGAAQRYIPPAHPNANADVETSHNLIEHEFYDVEAFGSRRDFFDRAATYQYRFNLTRKNSYKGSLTPLECLARDSPEHSPKVLDLPPIDLDRQLGRLGVGQYLPVDPGL